LFFIFLSKFKINNFIFRQSSVYSLNYDQLLEDKNLISALKIDCINLRGTIDALDMALQSATNLIEKLPSEN